MAKPPVTSHEITKLWTFNETEPADLSVSADGTAAVVEQLRHVVVAGELPEAGFQVQVPVEAQ